MPKIVYRGQNDLAFIIDRLSEIHPQFHDLQEMSFLSSQRTIKGFPVARYISFIPFADGSILVCSLYFLLESIIDLDNDRGVIHKRIINSNVYSGISIYFGDTDLNNGPLELFFSKNEIDIGYPKTIPADFLGRQNRLTETTWLTIIIDFIKRKMATVGLNTKLLGSSQIFLRLKNETQSLPPTIHVNSDLSLDALEIFDQVSDELKKQSTKLDRCESFLSRLERSIYDKKIILQSRHDYLRQLYTEKIIDDYHNLKVFTFDEKIIPYVLVSSSEMPDGETGTFHRNLIFVSRDIAKLEWQQQLIAFHEYVENETGSHEKAVKTEIILAKHIGVLEEYQLWIKTIRKLV